MISQFAVDPNLIGEWSNFQMFWGDFGISQRRQIGLFPKNWKQIAMERAHKLRESSVNSEMQLKKMEDRLFGEVAKSKFRKVNCSMWNPESSWLENCLRQEPEFEAIVATCSHPNERVVSKDDLLKDEPPYHQPTDYEIDRRPDSIVEALWSLLEQSKEIVLVDPNFDPAEPRFCGVLEIIIDRLHEAGKIPKRFEIHTSKYRKKDGARIPRVNQLNFENTLSPILFSNWKLCICAWAENRVEDYQHPRFLLTEIGGIHIDWGLDSGKPGERTLAKGLSEEVHQKLFSKYSAAGHAFSADSENESFLIT